jgi:hypothetical protein
LRRGHIKFVASDMSQGQKKIEKDAVTSSYKIFFLIKNEIIYLMQKTGLVYYFSS